MLSQPRCQPSLTQASYRIVITLLLIALVTIRVPSSRAATLWYVSPAGSDANSCRTLAAPCKAIGTVIGRSANGDTIVLAAGTYFETVTITKSLTLAGAGADTTAIDGNYTDIVLTIQAPAQVKMNGVSIQNGNGWYSGGIYNYYGDVTLSNSAVRNNRSFNGSGGGIYNNGALTLLNSIVEDNSAPFAGGGIYNTEGVVTINESVIRDNTAAYTRSALAGSYGGGILNNGTMTLNRSIVSGNHSYSSIGLSGGGGIANAGTLALIDSMISDNGTVGFGGGIDNRGELIVERSTINGNTVSRSIPRSDGGFGGGVYSLGSLSVTNSTMSDNSADDTGGAIWNTGTITLTNATISSNSAMVKGGGIAHVGGTIDMQNSILATNTNAAAPDCFGTLASQGYNLLGDNTGCTFQATTGDQIGTDTNHVDPRLDLLRNNGGSTMTRRLLSGSPAIDAANPAQPGSGGTACPITDQRGFRRPQGQRCDVGAYELGPVYFLPWVQR